MPNPTPQPRIDRASQAAERIFELTANPWQAPYRSEVVDQFAAIIRGAYAEETVMQARAEHLERVLAEVRALCESTAPWYSIRDAVLAILDQRPDGRVERG